MLRSLNLEWDYDIKLLEKYWSRHSGSAQPKSLAAQLHIDDFGTGLFLLPLSYCCLPDTLKIWLLFRQPYGSWRRKNHRKLSRQLLPRAQSRCMAVNGGRGRELLRQLAHQRMKHEIGQAILFFSGVQQRVWSGSRAADCKINKKRCSTVADSPVTEYDVCSQNLAIADVVANKTTIQNIHKLQLVTTARKILPHTTNDLTSGTA